MMSSAAAARVDEKTIICPAAQHITRERVSIPAAPLLLRRVLGGVLFTLAYHHQQQQLITIKETHTKEASGLSPKLAAPDATDAAV